jgi:hypothetical protein
MTERQKKEGSMAMNSATHRLGALRLAAAGGVTAAVIFVLCWIGAFIPFSSPTHAYIGLFTLAETKSVTALAEGTLWSFLFGILSGALFAAVYNLFASLDRR